MYNVSCYWMRYSQLNTNIFFQSTRNGELQLHADSDMERYMDLAV